MQYTVHSTQHTIQLCCTPGQHDVLHPIYLVAAPTYTWLLDTVYPCGDLSAPSPLGNNARYGNNTISTYAACETACNDDPNCTVFAFGNYTGVCQQCCWTKRPPVTCATIIVQGMTSYYKQTGNNRYPGSEVCLLATRGHGHLVLLQTVVL